MSTFLLLLLGLTTGCARAQDSSEGTPAAVAVPLKKARRGPGDPCEDECSSDTHTICDNSTKTCKCDQNFPVAIDHLYCLQPVLLGKPCLHLKQCQFLDRHSYCQKYTINYTECKCREEYEIKTLEGLAIPTLCLPILQLGLDLQTLKADVPTLLGLGLGMSMLSALICFVLKIFARARFARPRRYADARINPPLTVSGQLSREGDHHGRVVGSLAHGHKVYAIRRQSYPQRRASAALTLQAPPHAVNPQRPSLQPLRVIPEHPGAMRRSQIPRGVRSAPTLQQQDPRETYAAFALAANASTSSSPARDRHSSIRSGSRSASSSRRPSYSSIHPPRPGTRRSSQASLRLVAGDSRGEPIGYYVCIRDPVSVHSRGSRRPSQGSLASRASSSGDLREGRVHHFLYMRAPHHSLTSETNTTTTGTSDSSPRTPKSTEQLLAVYHSVPEHSVLELGGVGSSHTTSTLGTSSDDVFQEEDEDEEEQEEQEESKARLIV
ncbi:uncharacterized protein [Palaemon carinicauda]|uniref:uncharacterized protein isoform X2 n=1 Tax=Palaemon carinicauda TaxID=392227 RepID=UPI0035B5D0A5